MGGRVALSLLVSLLLLKPTASLLDFFKSNDLHGLAAAGDAAGLKRVLSAESSADVDAVDHEGETPLKIASVFGHVDAVKELLRHQASVGQSDDDPETALHVAAARDHAAVAKVLLAHSAPVDAQAAEGGTPLRYATQYGKAVDVAKLLLAHGASTELADDNDQTPLHVAAALDKRELAELLLNAKALPSPSSPAGTPLHMAVQYASPKMVRLLLDRGADMSAVDGKGKSTPLHTAVKFNRTAAAKSLLKRDLSCLTAMDGDGATPLHRWLQCPRPHPHALPSLASPAALCSPHLLPASGLSCVTTFR